MKRDKEMARKILSWVEANTPSFGSRSEEIRAGISCTDSNSEPYDYTLKLLANAGFLSRERSGTGHDYYELTWSGHDLLESLSS